MAIMAIAFMAYTHLAQSTGLSGSNQCPFSSTAYPKSCSSPASPSAEAACGNLFVEQFWGSIKHEDMMYRTLACQRA
jgi:hypothetical protein